MLSGLPKDTQYKEKKALLSLAEHWDARRGTRCVMTSCSHAEGNFNGTKIPDNRSGRQLVLSPPTHDIAHTTTLRQGHERDLKRKERTPQGLLTEDTTWALLLTSKGIYYALPAMAKLSLKDMSKWLPAASCPRHWSSLSIRGRESIRKDRKDENTLPESHCTSLKAMTNSRSIFSTNC